MEPKQVKALTRMLDYFAPGKEIAVYLMPFNREFELGYITTLRNSPARIIEEAQELAENIEKALPGSTIRVRVEDREDLTSICYVGSKAIYGDDGEELITIAEFFGEGVAA